MRDFVSFLDYVRGECALSGIKLKLEARKRTRAGDLGFYDEAVLFACVDSPGWAMNLAHEVGHLIQHRERQADYMKADVELFHDWLAGKRRLKPAAALALTRSIQRCELGAERYALKLAKKFRLTDDIAGYIRGANFYVWRYEVSRRAGKWSIFATRDEQRVLLELPARLMPRTMIGMPPSSIERAAMQ